MDASYYYSWNLLGPLENLLPISPKFILHLLFLVRKHSLDILRKIVLLLNLYHCARDVRHEIPPDWL